MPTSLNKYLDPAALDETVVNIRQLTEALEEEIQDLPYARPDGLYPDMTVGAVIGADETAQWATRESTGSGAATVRSVQGAAVVWNQLVPLLNDSAWQVGSNVTVTTDAEQNSIVVTSANDATGTKIYRLPNSFNPTEGHVLYIACEVETNADYAATFGIYATSGVIAAGLSVEAGTPMGRFATIATPSSVAYIAVRLNNSTSSGLSATFKNFVVIDLTRMFGSGNEPSTVAEFETMYPESYYPYSAPTLTPVRIAGIASTDANGDALDSVEWESYTLRAVGSVADMLYSDHVDVKVGATAIAIGEGVTFSASSDPNSAGLYNHTLQYTESAWAASGLGSAIYNASHWLVNAVSALGVSDATGASGSTTAGFQASDSSRRVYFRWPSLLTQAQFETLISGGSGAIFFVLATPTTTPISPALPMTYKVQAGGSESIIVPAGEVSAAPALTVAEPVNAGDEFARIWAAIQSLGYTRNAAQLSRPVSLTDIGSIDEVQDNTTEIETIKEVKE